MRTHEITGGMIEDGIGSHPEHVQAARHCDEAEAAGDVARADKWRKELGLQTSVEREKAARAAAEKKEKEARLVHDLHAQVAELHKRLDALDKKV